MVAQCYELYKSPQIGAITRVGDADNAAYCVVQEIRTESVDPGRRPTAMGKKVESLAQLHTANLQIEQLIKTDLDLLVFGRAQDERIETYYDHQWTPETQADCHDRLRRLEGPVYLSVDVDGLEPHLCPGTGTPQPGGLSWSALSGII